MIDRCDLVMQDVRVVLVEVEALFEDGLVISVKRDAGLVKEAGALKVAGLDLKQVVGAVAVLVDPTTDRISLVARFDIVRPVSIVGMRLMASRLLISTYVVLGVTTYSAGERPYVIIGIPYGLHVQPIRPPWPPFS
jgi:hypothetical protein